MWTAGRLVNAHLKAPPTQVTCSGAGSSRLLVFLWDSSGGTLWSDPSPTLVPAWWRG